MNWNEKSLLDRATHALKADVPDEGTINTAAMKAAQGLGIEMIHETFTGAIRNCDDVQQLFNSYRAGTLPEARALLVQAHLHDCGVCLRRFREEAAVNWAAPRIATTRRNPQVWGWALALSCVVLISALFVYRAYWQGPQGVRAEVQSISGSAYLISGSSNRRLAAGAELREGDELRTAGESHAVLRLADG